MSETITMRYRRGHALVDNIHLFTGTIQVTSDNPMDPETDNPFVGLKFSQMMSRLARVLRDLPDARVVLQRTDNPGLRAVQLGEETRVLLRDDPAAAIRAMTPQVGQPVQPEESDFTQRFMVGRTRCLRSGHETLADAFGEELYLTMKSGLIQDPESGHWLSLGFHMKSGSFSIRKDGSNKSSEWLPIELVGGPQGGFDSPEFATGLAQVRWAKVKTAVLLKRSCKKFYLPREWNTSDKRPWIPHEELRQKYQDYLEQKEKVTCLKDSEDAK